MCQQARLFFFIFLKMGFHHIAKAGLKLLDSHNLPTSASQSSGITGMNHHAQSCMSTFKSLWVKMGPIGPFLRRQSEDELDRTELIEPMLGLDKERQDP